MEAVGASLCVDKYPHTPTSTAWRFGVRRSRGIEAGRACGECTRLPRSELAMAERPRGSRDETTGHASSGSGASAQRDFYQLGETNIGRDQVNYNYYTVVSDPDSLRQDARFQQHRKLMINAVRSLWIENRLKRDLSNTGYVTLGLEEKLDTLEERWNQIDQETGRKTGLSSDSTSISMLFDQLRGKLLILGAPGSGKTMLMLKLTEELLNRAERDTNHPLPIVFHLSTWTTQRGSLAEWLIGELNVMYDVTPDLGRTWIENQHVLPLLDGLDEVRLEHRETCVNAIKEFQRNELGLFPLVVCSREEEYRALNTRLNLEGAVAIRPLTREQVDHYLQQVGAPLDGVRSVLRDDSSLWELLTSPLLLNIVALTYWNKSAVSIQAGTLDQRRSELFEAYISRMFQRRAGDVSFDLASTVRWLAWLAKGLRARNLTVLHLEWMQSDWVPSRISQRLVTAGTTVAVALLAALCTIILWAPFASASHLQLWAFLTAILVGANANQPSIRPADRLRWEWSSMLMTLAQRVLFGAIIFSLLGGLIGFLTGLKSSSPGNSELMYGSTAGLSIGAVTGFAVGLVAGLFAGLKVESEVPQPNAVRKARRPLRSALTAAAPFGVVFGVFGAVWGASRGLPWTLLYAIQFGVIAALIAGLRAGGLAYLQHYALRFMLARHDLAPRDYRKFLDFSVDRIFLYRIGDGYTFIHGLLMEHFASLDPASSRSRL